MSKLYYMLVPKEPQLVSHVVDFLDITEVLRNESLCDQIWTMIHREYVTRSKFLSIWQSVKFVATYCNLATLDGFLLVSAPVNWQIDYVTVWPSRRGEGIARSLLAETINQAIERNVPYICLTSKIELRKLYEGVGFKPVGMASLDVRPEDMAKQKSDEEAKKQWNNGVELGGTEKGGTDGQFAGQEQGGK
jgi:GNAT superfamily N-acetyltransferase